MLSRSYLLFYSFLVNYDYTCISFNPWILLYLKNILPLRFHFLWAGWFLWGLLGTVLNLSKKFNVLPILKKNYYPNIFSIRQNYYWLNVFLYVHVLYILARLSNPSKKNYILNKSLYLWKMLAAKQISSYKTFHS